VRSPGLGVGDGERDERGLDMMLIEQMVIVGGEGGVL
jgi:hypothetical protein